MVYVCSDVHGEYDLFVKLLDKIKFSSADKMFVCGDMIDKGESSVRLLRLIMANKNVSCIAGNHEYAFLKLYQSLLQEEKVDFDKALDRLKAYFVGDGHLLDWEVVDWLETLPFYIEQEQFVCVHAGLPLDEDGRVLPPSVVTREQLVYDRRFKDKDVYPKADKCVFFGHTPTTYLVQKPKILGYINPTFKGENSVKKYCKVHLDLGTWINKVMGCFCVDNLAAYYVSE